MTEPVHPPPATRQRHWEMLAISAFVIAFSFLLDVRDGDVVTLRGFPNLTLPQTCTSRSLLGISCPGCGLTRSFVFLARGDLPASWQQHHLGWLMALAVALQIPYRALSLRRRDRPIIPPGVARAFGFTLIGLLIGNWIVGLLVR